MAVREKSTVVTIIVLLLQIQAFAGEWPQWRGPNRDGVWREKGIVQTFEGRQLPVLWRAKIANGYSGPSVVNGRVYITDRLTPPIQVERVHCFDAHSSQEIWSHAYECRYVKIGYPDGPRASVSIDDGRAYSLGAAGNLFCFIVLHLTI